MKVKALRSFYGNTGSVKRGQVIEVSDYRAKQLLKKGIVTDVLSEPKPAASKPKDPEPDPTQAAPVGGQTGAAEPAPSWRQAPARKTSTSKSSGRRTRKSK